MNLPNTLSLLRVLSVPVFIGLMVENQTHWALWLFAGAGLTDALDGFVAKRFDMETELGKYLDPLADKVLLMSGFITLTAVGLLPLWLTLMVVTRDTIIVVGALLYQMMTGALHIQPSWSSKLNTVAQMFLLLLVLFHHTHGVLSVLLTPMIWLTALTTLVSGGGYVVEWGRQASRQARTQEPSPWKTTG